MSLPRRSKVSGEALPGAACRPGPRANPGAIRRMSTIFYDLDPTDAKRICAECSVQEQCLDIALSTPEFYGTWGGKSEEERRLLRQLKEPI
ncbi:MAG: WhiB family transcriptional regulator [candidate division NC10 bacterium]